MLSPTGTKQQGLLGSQAINQSILSFKHKTVKKDKSGRAAVMSRFESPVHVLVLFVIASFLSIGIIYFINAEQESRIRHSSGVAAYSAPDDTKPQQHQQENDETFLSYISYGLSNFLTHFKNATLKVESLVRNKRSSRIEIESNLNQGRKLGLGSERRDTSSDFHRIRHALKKLDNGGMDGDALYRMMQDPNPQRKNMHKQNQATEKQPKTSPQDFYFQYQEEIKSTPSPPPPQIPEAAQVTAAELYGREEEMSLGQVENGEGGVEESGSFPIRKEAKEKAPPQFNNGSSGESQVRRSVVEVDVCYGTDDVLIVIGITCSLNFAFVLLIYACVRWFSNSKGKELNSLDVDDDEGGGDRGGSLDDEEFWISTGGNGRRKFNTASMHAIKQESEHHEDGLRKSHSYSMEDLRFTKNS